MEITNDDVVDSRRCARVRVAPARRESVDALAGARLRKLRGMRWSGEGAGEMAAASSAAVTSRARQILAA